MKKFFKDCLAWLILIAAFAGVFAVIALVYWLDHVRFVI